MPCAEPMMSSFVCGCRVFSPLLSAIQEIRPDAFLDNISFIFDFFVF